MPPRGGRPMMHVLALQLPSPLAILLGLSLLLILLQRPPFVDDVAPWLMWPLLLTWNGFAIWLLGSLGIQGIKLILLGS